MANSERSDAKQLSLEVAQFLRAERERLEVSKNELAQRSGLSRTAIRLIEEGKRQPTIHTAALLFEALGVRFSDAVLHAEAAAKNSKSKR